MKLVELSINNHIVDVIHKHHTVLQNVGFGTHGNPLFVEAVLNSETGAKGPRGARENTSVREKRQRVVLSCSNYAWEAVASPST